MARIMLVTWDGAGNLPPELALACALIERGHTVYALTHDSIRIRLERDGLNFLPLRNAEQLDSLDDIPLEKEPLVMDRVFFGEGFSMDLLEAVEAVHPDLLVVDGFLSFGLVAALRSGLPTVALWHTLYSVLADGPFGTLFDSRISDINRHAQDLGLAPYSSFQNLIESVDRVLVSSFAPFDAASDPVDPHVKHVGPLRPAPPRDPVWQGTGSDLPFVVVALSTSGQGQIPLLQRLCDALAKLPVEALITTGPAVEPDRLSTASNTQAVEFAAHDIVLPTANLLVTHAGHGTVMAGVRQGVPMLCIPMGRDQPALAARVEELELGFALPPDTATDELAAAIWRMLEDPSILQRSRRFAATLTHHPGLDEAIEIVEGLLDAELQ